MCWSGIIMVSNVVQRLTTFEDLERHFIFSTRLTRLAETSERAIHNVDIIRGKWFREKLECSLHCIKNPGRRTKLWNLDNVAAGRNSTNSRH